MWRGGLERLEDNFKWNKGLYDTREQRLAAVKDGSSSKTVEQVMEEALVFPYRALFGRRLEEEDQANACESHQYVDILNEVEVFVLYRIRELTQIRVGQTPFRLVHARATETGKPSGKPGSLRRQATAAKQGSP